MTTQAKPSADDTHDWHTRTFCPAGPKARKIECCRTCGIVRRADHKNLACKGVVKVSLRTQANQSQYRKDKVNNAHK